MAEDIQWIKLREKHLQQKLHEISLYEEIRFTAKIKGLEKEIEFIKEINK